MHPPSVALQWHGQPPAPVYVRSPCAPPPPPSLPTSLHPLPPMSFGSNIPLATSFINSSIPPPPRPVHSNGTISRLPPSSLNSSMPPPPPPPPVSSRGTMRRLPVSSLSTGIPESPGAPDKCNNTVHLQHFPASSNRTTQSTSSRTSTVPPPSSSRATSTNKNGSATSLSSEAGNTQTPVGNTANSSEQSSSEIKLAEPLEKILAFGLERAGQLGVNAVSAQTVEEEPNFLPPSTSEEPEMTDDVDDDLGGEEKETKRKRNKKKKKRQRPSNLSAKQFDPVDKCNLSQSIYAGDPDIEYVQEILDVSDPAYSQFINVFEKFKLIAQKKSGSEVPMDTSAEDIKQETTNIAVKERKIAKFEDDDDDKKDEDEKPKLSKRKMRKLSRMTVAELKQKVIRPDLVEMHDVTAKDPLLLLHLKAYRNAVPVPRHWCFKRKYLQGKRGIEKPPFELPDFIKRTGIMEIREAFQEKEDQKTMKGQMRNKVRPKLGNTEIDYQILHDAFFKWQTKPKMTIHGDLYYEGKESETRFKDKKPGDLSEELRIALGMPTGPNANKCPPPWLIAMQRYGPPPSYPNLKIPGLNAPVPDGCSFGYHAGGWGKPPVDEAGKPLYGDVFGTQICESQPQVQKEEFDRTLWGELESESSEEEEEEDEDDDEIKAEDETGLATSAEGLNSPSGSSTVLSGMETPDMIELRKERMGADIEGDETPSLYSILPEKRTEKLANAMMGSTHIYDFTAAVPASRIKMSAIESVPNQGIEVALDPSELELDSAAMEARYEQTVREQQPQLEKEDLSDMVAEHTARQKKKRKRTQDDSGKPPKKYKEFKF